MKLLQLVYLFLNYTFHLLLLDYTFHSKFTIFNLSLITSTCLMLNNLPHLLVWMYDASLLCKFFWYQSFGMYHSSKGTARKKNDALTTHVHRNQKIKKPHPSKTWQMFQTHLPFIGINLVLQDEFVQQVCTASSISPQPFKFLLSKTISMCQYRIGHNSY